MSNKLLLISIVSMAALTICMSTSIHAQETEADSKLQAESPATQKPGKTDTKEKPGPRLDIAPPSIEMTVLEEVVVQGKRIERDGSRRRTAAGRKELDSTDQTDLDGFFDDIDGLSTLGGDDQGNSFSLNGLSPDLSNVTLNGQTFGEGRGNGGFGAGNLPPDMIRRVDIYKTPTAALEEGGVGGSVDLQLRNPVDITSASTDIKGRVAYVPEKTNFNPSVSFFTARQSESKTFGYMLSLTMREDVKEYGSQRVTDWDQLDVDVTPAFIPSQVRNDAVDDKQRNIFGGLTLGFRPHRTLDISANLFLTQRTRDIETHGLQHRIDKQRQISILDFDGRIATELQSSDRSRRNLRIAGSTRNDLTNSLVLGMNINWRYATWRLAVALGYNTDKNESDQPSQSIVFESNSAFGYNTLDDGSMIMNYPDGFPLTPSFATNRINLSDKNTKDTNAFGGIDMSRPLSEGFFRRISFGGKIREMTRSRNTSNGRINLDESMTLTDFFSGQFKQTPWDANEWPSSDMDDVNSLVQESEIDWRENLLNEYDMERQTNAVYLQSDFRTSEAKKRFLVGNIGVRIVATDTWIAGFQETGEAIEPVSIDTNYTDVLPSLSMRMRIAERAALAFGLAKVMTHPSFNDLAPGIRFNYSDKTARSGNPLLEPFRANQAMTELTWVPVRGTRLRVNLAYRDVDSYFALSEESIEFEGDTYLVTRPINGEDGYILTAGVKLDQNLRHLTRHLRNFGLSLSYVHNKSGTEMDDPYTGEELPMPNTAEQVVKVELNYGNNKSSGKLSYQWRGESLKASVSESGLSVWNQPVGSLNLNWGWRLNDTFQLSFDARNLLSEDQVQSTDHDTQIWRINERNRSIAVTLRAKW